MLRAITLLAAALAADADEVVLWQLDNGVVHGPAGHRGADGPLPVGSLVKPFVAEAWARAHPGDDPPVVLCERGSGCWRPQGHGKVGLLHGLSVSCNTYFNKMAAATPVETLAATLRAEGFGVPDPLGPESAIGLETEGGAVTARPDALLKAYARLVAAPWSGGEDVRRTVLAGLRESAILGTARGLGRRGFWAKTGTVPALDGRPLATSGWAIAVDDSGWAVLALLPHGTGREAAAALAGPLGRLRPWSAPRVETARTAAQVVALTAAKVVAAPAAPVRAPGRVRVGLLETLRPRALAVTNLGAAPAGSSRGFVGPRASLGLRPGDRLDESLWELALPGRRFLRRVRGSLSVESGPNDTLRLRADLLPEEYVLGVIAAELPGADLDRRIRLAAAVLRFLADGPRHGAYDVCDSTHCAWFVGRGPRVLWPTPVTPVLLAAGPGRTEDEPGFDAAAWAHIRAEAGRDGPRLFSGHCGGAPLSPHAVWGNGDRRVFRCERHASGAAAAWARRWGQADLTRAFGAPVAALEVTAIDGVWTLRARAGGRNRDLRYDEAHRLLAATLGWDALPSPADRVFATAGGFRAEGVGSGHRVGLCLGE